MNPKRIFGLGLIGLAALSISSMSVAAGPRKPVLTTQFFSQSVSLTPWFNSVTLPGPCSNGNSIPALGGLNFTENLSGKDPGSTWIQFKGNFTGLWLFSQADLTLSLLREFICGASLVGTSLPVLAKAQALVVGNVPGSTMWRVPASGSFTSILESTTGFATFAGTQPPTNVVANETWTVTTIS